MAAALAGCRKALVGTDWAISHFLTLPLYLWILKTYQQWTRIGQKRYSRPNHIAAWTRIAAEEFCMRLCVFTCICVCLCVSVCMHLHTENEMSWHVWTQQDLRIFCSRTLGTYILHMYWLQFNAIVCCVKVITYFMTLHTAVNRKPSEVFHRAGAHAVAARILTIAFFLTVNLTTSYYAS